MHSCSEIWPAVSVSGGVNVKSSWYDEEEADNLRVEVEEEGADDCGATKAMVDGRSDAPITAAVPMVREDFIVSMARQEIELWAQLWQLTGNRWFRMVDVDAADVVVTDE